MIKRTKMEVAPLHKLLPMLPLLTLLTLLTLILTVYIAYTVVYVPMYIAIWLQFFKTDT